MNQQTEREFYSTMDTKLLAQRAAEAACGWDFIEDNIEVDDRRGLSHINGDFV